MNTSDKKAQNREAQQRYRAKNKDMLKTDWLSANVQLNIMMNNERLSELRFLAKKSGLTQKAMLEKLIKESYDNYSDD